jgi:hypothetical protein
MADMTIEKIGQWLANSEAAIWIAVVAFVVTPFVLAFAISRRLMRRLMRGNREISAGFSPSGASALLAVTGGQLFHWSMSVLVFATAKSIWPAIIAGVIFFVPLFSLAIPITLLYFCLVLRKKNVADGTLIWLVAGLLLIMDILWLYPFLGGDLK